MIRVQTTNNKISDEPFRKYRLEDMDLPEVESGAEEE
jgi:hypothetical protein